jgi:hypothetical protein
MASARSPPTAMVGPGRVRQPSWQAKADLAAGHRVRLLADGGPAPNGIALDVSATRLASPRIAASSITSSSAGGASIRPAYHPTFGDGSNQYSILKRCQMAVVYQAADQSRFRSFLVMNAGSIPSDLIVARTDSTP